MPPVSGATAPAPPPPLPQGTAPKAPPVDLRPFEAPEDLFQKNSAQAPAQQQEPSKESVEGQVEAINKLMSGLNNRLEFGLFQDTDQLYVKVVDRRNGQVVKVLPPEDFLELSQKIADAVGLILDEEI